MSATDHGVFGPTVGDVQAYNSDQAGGTSFSVDTGESPDKIQGNYHATQFYYRPIPDAITETRRWTASRVELNELLGGLGAGTVVMFLAGTTPAESGGVNLGLFLSWVRVSDTTANIRLSSFTTTHGTTSVAYTTGTTVTIRTETTGSRCKVWINGTLEFDVAETDHWLSLWLCNPSHNTYEHLWWLGGLRGGTSGADRPGTSVEAVLSYPIGNYGGVNDYGGEAGAGEDCADNTIGDEALWDDYASSGTHDSAATYNCIPGGTAGKEISTMSAVAVTRTPGSATARALSQGNIPGKTITTYMVEKADDGGASESEVQNDNIFWDSSAGWLVIGGVFTAPPVGSWSDYLDSNTIFNGTTGAPSTYKLSLGLRSVDTNTSNDLHTAIFFEVGSMDDDPEPAADTPFQERGIGRGVKQGVGRGV